MQKLVLKYSKKNVTFNNDYMGWRCFSEQTTCLKYKSLLKIGERSLKIPNLDVAPASIFQPDLQLPLYRLVSKYRFLFTYVHYSLWICVNINKSAISFHLTNSLPIHIMI